MKSVNLISLQEWNDLVTKTYSRPYNFQQQDGCRNNGGLYGFTLPSKNPTCDYENDTVKEIVNGDEMGVKFSAWLSRNPKQKLVGQEYDYELDLWWERNFYPHIDMIIDDLYKRGYLDNGKYVIEVSW